MRLHIKIVTPKSDFYIGKDEIIDSDNYRDAANNYKVMFTRVVAGDYVVTRNDGMYNILSSVKVLRPREICNASYMVVSHIQSQIWADNICMYLKTKFVRFLILQTLFGIGLIPDRFQFIPMQDFSNPWTDEMLYKKYNLTQDEIDCIENTIKPMD